MRLSRETRSSIAHEMVRGIRRDAEARNAVGYGLAIECYNHIYGPHKRTMSRLPRNAFSHTVMVRTLATSGLVDLAMGPDIRGARRPVFYHVETPALTPELLARVDAWVTRTPTTTRPADVLVRDVVQVLGYYVTIQQAMADWVEAAAQLADAAVALHGLDRPTATTTPPEGRYNGSYYNGAQLARDLGIEYVAPAEPAPVRVGRRRTSDLTAPGNVYASTITPAYFAHDAATSTASYTVNPATIGPPWNRRG